MGYSGAIAAPVLPRARLLSDGRYFPAHVMFSVTVRPAMTLTGPASQ